MAPNVAMAPTVPTIATVKVRLRNRSSASSGCGLRTCWRTNNARVSTPTAPVIATAAENPCVAMAFTE
ncbi:Uncharacterised protein [Mycobacteroides abscessus subsp. abscessus]|nr:Uncharacterised protein [Mycobacteroides abscessus subsp. abscessus]SKW37414.1 Uncharacterised protein [Mycobacteroides abscessus subsp. abscessus]